MPGSAQDYIAKGFDAVAAEYFAAGRKKAVAVCANDDFSLIITFDNGERRRFDVRPLMQAGTVFHRLAAPDVFKRVYIDDVHSVAWDIDPAVDSSRVWSNKIDLCSDTCYLDSVPC